MTQTHEEIAQILGSDIRWNADNNAWERAKAVIGDRRVALGSQASQQWLEAPEHLAMVLARYRAAAALIGAAETVLEIGCGEGIGAGILAKGRRSYHGIDLDRDAIAVARQTRSDPCLFEVGDARHLHAATSAAVALDVIEHVEASDEADVMAGITWGLPADGVCVIGTPNAAFEHLASPQSRAGHVNLYTHERLHALMSQHFRVVQSFGMQDTGLHLGHPDARHYLLLCGIGPRRRRSDG